MFNIYKFTIFFLLFIYLFVFLKFVVVITRNKKFNKKFIIVAKIETIVKI